MSAPKPSLPGVLRRLDVQPAEVAALVVLALGAVAAVALLWWLQRPLADAVPAAAQPTDVAATDDPGGLDVSAGEVIVHVAGAVFRPGVYTLPGGSRVGQAVEAAGGARRRAVLDGLNLARVVADGEQVMVPDKRSMAAPAAPETAGAAAGGSAAGDASKIGINQATAADFETLPGIGPVLAERIVAHRDSIGGFSDVGELRDVPGIGEKTFQSLVPLVSI